MADFVFVDEMLTKCDGKWSYSFLLGALMSEVRLYLLNVNDRQELTAFFACLNIACEAYSRIGIEPGSDGDAARRTQEFLKSCAVPSPTSDGAGSTARG
jgi:hypothetical protein